MVPALEWLREYVKGEGGVPAAQPGPSFCQGQKKSPLSLEIWLQVSGSVSPAVGALGSPRRVPLFPRKLGGRQTASP